MIAKYFLVKSWIEIPDWCGKCSYKRHYVYFLQQHNLNSFGYLLCEWLCSFVYPYLCLHQVVIVTWLYYRRLRLPQVSTNIFSFIVHWSFYPIFFRLKEYQRRPNVSEHCIHRSSLTMKIILSTLFWYCLVTIRDSS